MSAAGVLYVVATPIGNLADLTDRAREVLGAADLIAAEDTRRTRQLLTHLGISKRLVSVHEHNESARAEALLQQLNDGQSIALVSDAGTPLISDPGFRLVAAARAAGLSVVPVPGASAAVAALSVAGLPSDRFRFEGFLPARPAARARRIQSLATAAETLVFYVSIHRAADDIEALIEGLGGARRAALFRELTKQHETSYHGSLTEVLRGLVADPGGSKGELTLVVEGCREAPEVDAAELQRIFRLLAEQLPPSQAAALAARITGAKRSAAYALAKLPDQR